MHPYAPQARALLHSRDPQLTAQGLELLATLGDPALYAELLQVWRLAHRGRLTWRGPREDRPPWAPEPETVLGVWAGIPREFAARLDLRWVALELQWPRDAGLAARLADLPRLERLIARIWDPRPAPLLDAAALPRGLRELELSRFDARSARLAGAPAGLGTLTLEWCDLAGLALPRLALPGRLRLLGCRGEPDLDGPGEAPLRLEIEHGGADLARILSRLPRLRALRALGRLAGFPPAAAGLADLEELALDGCGLREIPPEIGDLPRLRRLRLGGNPLAALPAAVGRLRALEELQLSRTRLRELPPELADLPRLSSLSLRHTPLTALPEGLLLALPALRRLDVGARLRPQAEALAARALRERGRRIAVTSP